MQKNYLTIGLALVVVVIGLAILARIVTAPPAQEQSFFPDKLTVRVQLPNEELNEVRRVAYYADDNTTLKSLEVEYVDGFTGLASFKPSGSISTFTKFYPRGDLETPQAQMKLVYAEDGVHLVSDEHYYESGALKQKGNRLAYGNYNVFEYPDGDKTPSSQSIYDFDGVAYKAFEHHANGQIAKLVRETKEAGLETFRFSDAGVRTTYHSVKWETQIVWETYRDDGETLLTRFEQKSEGNQFATSYAIFASYYRPDGSVYEERKFSRSLMTVDFKDEEGNTLFQQSWYPKKSPSAAVDSFDIDSWVLNAVYISPMYSNSYWFDRQTAKPIRHNRDITIKGGVIKMEYKWYHPDGSLAKRKTPNFDTGEYEVTEYEPGESKEVVNKSLVERYTQAKPYVVPPQITPETVSHSGGGGH